MRLRMPPELRDQIEEAAKSNNRSMNAEIVSRLEQSFSPSQVDVAVNKAANQVATHMSEIFTASLARMAKELGASPEQVNEILVSGRWLGAEKTNQPDK